MSIKRWFTTCGDLSEYAVEGGALGRRYGRSRAGLGGPGRSFVRFLRVPVPGRKLKGNCIPFEPLAFLARRSRRNAPQDRRSSTPAEMLKRPRLIQKWEKCRRHLGQCHSHEPLPSVGAGPITVLNPWKSARESDERRWAKINAGALRSFAKHIERKKAPIRLLLLGSRPSASWALSTLGTVGTWQLGDKLSDMERTGRHLMSRPSTTEAL